VLGQVIARHRSGAEQRQQRESQRHRHHLLVDRIGPTLANPYGDR
jgi:hypothetical protein